MKKIRLEEIYNDYAAKVLPRQAGAIQRRETRQAFFVGAFSMLGILKQATDEGADEVGIMRDLESEMEAFADATARGGAR